MTDNETADKLALTVGEPRRTKMANNADRTVPSEALLEAIGNRIDALRKTLAIELELQSEHIPKFQAAIAELEAIRRLVNNLASNAGHQFRSEAT